jgi:predicted phage tail protein
MTEAQEPEVRQPDKAVARAPKQQGWKRYLKLGACCGAPLLVVLLLAGGGGALLGAAGAFLPYLAALACPLGMYFMMRGMWKMEQQHRKSKDPGGEK